MTNWQDEFLILLRGSYAAQHAKNPRYSIRAFSQQLGTAPGPTSALIKGTKVWNISPEWALNVMDKMNLKTAQKNRIRVLIGEKPRLKRKQVENLPETLSTTLCHWAYWPVLVHFEMRAQKPNPDHIALRLDIQVTEVEEIIADLIARGFLVQADDGKLQRSSEGVDLADDVLNLASRSMHRTNLTLAHKALEAVPLAEREFQTLTVAGSQKVMAEAKAEIRNFTDKMACLLNKEDENDKIYRFSVQLFPLNFGGFK